jgi:hypothetical protein
MNSQLKSVIQKVKEQLILEPDGIIFGELHEGNHNAHSNHKILQRYFDFLKESDGARCGAIDLWSFNELDTNQYRVTELSGSIEKWFEIGQILYEPLVIDKISGEVYLFEGYPDGEGRSFGDLEDFLLNYVFGGRYAEIIPNAESDEWYQFLKRINLA